MKGQPKLEFNIEPANQDFIFFHPGRGIVIALYDNKKASFYASITNDARKAMRKSIG